MTLEQVSRPDDDLEEARSAIQTTEASDPDLAARYTQLYLGSHSYFPPRSSDQLVALTSEVLGSLDLAGDKADSYRALIEDELDSHGRRPERLHARLRPGPGHWRRPGRDVHR